MTLSLLIKIKGWVTAGAGIVFLIVPLQFFSIVMDASLGDAGVTITRLFGLVLMALGWGLAIYPNNITAGSMSLVIALTDILAVVLLLWSINMEVFGVFGYELVLLYALSAVLFIFKYLHKDENLGLQDLA
jgi:hypothetical protein